MRRQFDLIVVGTGTAASAVAGPCRAAGWSVAVIDSRAFGGTCALRGCDPKKVLVSAAELVDWNRRMAGKGLSSNHARIDWPELMRFKRTFTDPVPQAREQALAKAGIVGIHGRARFTGPNTLRVNEDELTARFIVIAAGRKPVRLDIAGEEHLATSDQFLDLDRLPDRICLIGGGYIAFEFAHLAVRAGARVTILHRDDHPLPRFDSDLVHRLLIHSRDLGIQIELGAEAKAVVKDNAHFAVVASAGGRERAAECDLAVHAAGRVPDIEDLNLDEAGVEHDAHGVRVNEFLQSPSNPCVYAAGDAAASAGPPLTPVAGYEGSIVAKNLLGGNRHQPDRRGIPTVVFSVPPLAAVGLTEPEAKSLGLQYEVHTADTAGWFASRHVGETASGFKTLVEAGTGRLLGAHLLGARADDVINLFALVIRFGVPVPALADAPLAYPTVASILPYMLG